MDRPKVADIVHYVSYGTPHGEYKSVCRAAIITAIGEEYDKGIEVIDLCVINPEGMYFNRSVDHDEEPGNGGTWHWPERE